MPARRTAAKAAAAVDDASDGDESRDVFDAPGNSADASAEADGYTLDAERPSKRRTKLAAGAAGRTANKLTFIDRPTAQPAQQQKQGQGTPRKSLGAGSDAPSSARKRLSVVDRSAAAASASASGVSDGAMPRVSMETMNNNFEEWMKLATDNKITATNTWNFALIDYFADMTLLRNGPNDQSINFQKASCTLDGCVKIWTSRVDSVASETGKLLSGLSSGGNARDEGEGDPDDPDAEEDAARREKRKATRSEATLAKSFAALQVKKFDLEFTVDPLFKKTCADFDEGGAMGLLMNHLGVDGKGRVVFDAGDVEVDEEEEEGEEEGEEEEEDLEMDRLQEFLPTADDLASRNISVTLGDFKFSSDGQDAFHLSSLGLGSGSGIGSDKDGGDDNVFDGAAQQGEHDFFGDDDAGAPMDGGDYDMGMGMGMGMGGGGDDDEGGGGGFAAGGASGSGSGMVAGMDGARRNPANGDRMFVGLAGDHDDADGMMLDYFDQGFMRNWAGPEHWKLRRVTRKPDPNAMAVARQARKEKAPFLIDFESPATINARELFAAAPRSSISVAKPADGRRRTKGGRASTAVKRDTHLLPDDMHFSSRQLLRLFLKPKFTLKMRKQGAVAAQMQNADGEIDEGFWAQAAAERAEMGAEGMEDDGNAPPPFESQFFHDDADDGADFAEVDDGLGDVLMADDLGEGAGDDLWAGTQSEQLRKAKPESVHYAKKAKRVDVKRLKDNIWRGLDLPIDVDAESETESEASIPTVKNDGDAFAEPKTFDSVIQNLRQSYPAEKMSEISTSFCFICLLHLANEQGLKIEPARLDDGGDADMDMGYAGEAVEAVSASWGGKIKGAEVDERADRIVGELQALRIWKDPHAIKAA